MELSSLLPGFSGGSKDLSPREEIYCSRYHYKTVVTLSIGLLDVGILATICFAF
jgi:hypothetical protein